MSLPRETFLSEDDVLKWSRCPTCATGRCTGQAEITLDRPKGQPNPRYDSLKAYVVPPGPVCRPCAQGRTRLWESLCRRLRFIQPSIAPACQTGFQDLVRAIEGHDAAFLRHIEQPPTNILTTKASPLDGGCCCPNVHTIADVFRAFSPATATSAPTGTAAATAAAPAAARNARGRSTEWLTPQNPQ